MSSSKFARRLTPSPLTVDTQIHTTSPPLVWNWTTPLTLCADVIYGWPLTPRTISFMNGPWVNYFTAQKVNMITFQFLHFLVKSRRNNSSGDARISITKSQDRCPSKGQVYQFSCWWRSHQRRRPQVNKSFFPPSSCWDGLLLSMLLSKTEKLAVA